jgi:hypothetical protein
LNGRELFLEGEIAIFIGTYNFLGVFIYSENKNHEKIFLELSTNRIIFHEFIEKRMEFGHTGDSLGEKRKVFLASALLEAVTCLLIRCYKRISVNQADHRNCDSKVGLFFLVFFCDIRQQLKECFEGYQQVIHNRKMPTDVVFELVTTPKNNTIEVVELHKCMYIQIISRIANRW